jgi:hypothetical protein
MAQTTRDTSFGPVYVAAAVTNPLTRLECQYNLIELKTLVRIKEKQKKDSPMAQTTCLASFGPVYVALSKTNPLPC